MTWMLITGLIVFGIGLVIIETIFVPGTTFVGVIGFVFTILGVYQAFDSFGSPTGWYVLLLTTVLLIVALVLSFRTRAWEKLALNKSHSGRVYENRTESLNIGDRGIAVSSLKPIGKGLFEDREYEVSTLGEYTDSGVEIEIIKIEPNKIIVKSISN